MAQELDYAGGMDFSALAAAAQAKMDAVDIPDAPAAKPAETVTDINSLGLDAAKDDSIDTGDASASTSSQVAEQGNVLDIAEDALVKVKIDGEIVQVPYKEFKDSLQREAAWHKRQQAFAEGKRQVEQTYAQRFAELERGAQALQMYEQKLMQMGMPQAQVQQQVQQKADEIATLGEVRQEAERVGKTVEQLIAARDQQLGQQFNKQLVDTVQRLKAEQAQEREANRFTKGLNEVLSAKEFKALEAIPNLEQNLRYAVFQNGPESIEDAIDQAKTIAKMWNEKLRTIHVAEQQKADAQKAKAKLEPSDGSPVAPKNTSKPKSYIGKDGKLNHTALREAALALLD
jgi:hypothetical protein